jgi:speckle-type POZ protein
LAFQACGGKEFPVHRYVLAARSPVFKATFSHEETKEVQTGEVEIEDVDPETLEVLIKYIYTDTVGDEDWTIDLLSAADKYNLVTLLNNCELR